MRPSTFIRRFESAAQEIVTTVKAKNADYCGSKDPFKNFRMAEELDVTPVEIGIFTRLLDKVSRASTLLRKDPDVIGESIHDTLKDLAAYSIILSIYLHDKNDPKYRYEPEEEEVDGKVDDKWTTAPWARDKEKGGGIFATVEDELAHNQANDRALGSMQNKACPIGCFRFAPHTHGGKKKSGLMFGWPWWAFFALGVASGLISDVVRWVFSL